MFHALALGCEAGPSVEFVDGSVQGLVGLAEVGRHEVWVVQVGKCRVRMIRASGKNGIRVRALDVPERSDWTGGSGKRIVNTTPMEYM